MGTNVITITIVFKSLGTFSFLKLKAEVVELEIEAEADYTTSAPLLWVDGFYGP